MLGLINTGRATQACGWCQGLSIRSGYLGPVPAAGYLDGQSSGRIYPWIYQFRPRLYVQSSNGCNLAPKSSFIRSCKQGLKRFQRPPRRSLHGPFFGRLLSQGSPILANYPGLVLGSLGRTIWPRRRSVWSLRSSPVSKTSSPISKTQCCCPTSTSVCPGNNSLCLGIICERLGISKTLKPASKKFILSSKTPNSGSEAFTPFSLNMGAKSTSLASKTSNLASKIQFGFHDDQSVPQEFYRLCKTCGLLTIYDRPACGRPACGKCVRAQPTLQHRAGRRRPSRVDPSRTPPTTLPGRPQKPSLTDHVSWGSKTISAIVIGIKQNEDKHIKEKNLQFNHIEHERRGLS